jgi:ornithine lipid hydroxylase
MNDFTRNALKWTAYPAVMTVCILIYYGLISCGINLSLSSFIAGIVGGLGLITLLEIILPYRKEWLPNRSEIKTDLIFMLITQIALPKLLTIITVVYLVSFTKTNGIQLAEYWPHDWPNWIQMMLMMFLADLMRYWLHRAAHEWIPLWRVHAVHHSVQKLYWLNVGRFHPIDKSLQFLCDALPFILLGVTQEVMTLYFVVYSIKGFFQHSNVDVKLGWLNYIISGPELHRWHHSKTIKESNTNYGNNVIIWDILFGTFFYPKEKSVKDLGLLNRNYPSDFLTQMKTPFIKGIDKAK